MAADLRNPYSCGFDHTYTTTNFFQQADRAADLMRAHDEQVLKSMLEKLPEGTSLKSIHWDDWDLYEW